MVRLSNNANHTHHTHDYYSIPTQMTSTSLVQHSSHTPSSTPSPTSVICRANCYKLLIAIVLVFLLMQYTANFLAIKHKYNISQSLPWLAISSYSNSSDTHHSSNLDYKSKLSYNMSNSLPSLSSFNNSLKNDFRRTINSVNSNSGTIDSTSAYQVNDSSANVTSSLEICPLVPPKLVGRLKVLEDCPPFEELESMFPDLEPGGRFRPKQCIARHKVAIIIPYRDREEHLRMFLHNIHFVLMRQQLDYGIYIVEESGVGKFNRAKLMNVGFVEALKQYDYQCFIFHDVDLIPEDDRNLYTCPEQPRHMSVAIDKFSYRLPYKDLFGGVSALTKEQFEKINGFSNEFWGWGGEDDDMSNRIRYYGYKISRYPADIARYKMLKHKGDEPNPDRYKKLYSGRRRYKTDGINNVSYKRVDIVFKKLYTWILVDVLGP